MTLDHTARTGPGGDLVALADLLAHELAHDRTDPFAAIQSIVATRFHAAPIPAEHGGLGVSSVHDIAVACRRIARWDATVAAAVRTQIAAGLGLAREHAQAFAAGHRRHAAVLAAEMEDLARGDLVLASRVRPHGRDLVDELLDAAIAVGC
jgi:alkylation response protein AidB-like acyl-CoA dehydrogenase